MLYIIVIKYRYPKYTEVHYFIYTTSSYMTPSVYLTM